MTSHRWPPGGLWARAGAEGKEWWKCLVFDHQTQIFVDETDNICVGVCDSFVVSGGKTLVCV